MVLLFSSGVFVGNFSYAPGTFASLLGIPLCYIIFRIHILVAVFCTVGFILFAVWIAHRAEKILDQKDPRCIVIDEIAGFLVTLLGLPFDLFTVGISFIVFRVLDVLKPFPIRVIERKISGGVGVVLDDVVAGMFSNLIVRGLILVTAPYNG
jgi:phosphatidylglycerophosphatase A